MHPYYFVREFLRKHLFALGGRRNSFGSFNNNSHLLTTLVYQTLDIVLYMMASMIEEGMYGVKDLDMKLDVSTLVNITIFSIPNYRSFDIPGFIDFSYGFRHASISRC